MKAIVCEMCGSQDLIKQDGYYVCQNCGTKYDPEEAKKLMIDVKLDNSDAAKKWYQLARQARDSNDAESAAKYYELILQENPDDWEAYFYNTYFRAMQTKIAFISNAANMVANITTSLFQKIKKLPDTTQQKLAASEVYLRVKQLAILLESNARSTYKSSLNSMMGKGGGEYFTQYAGEYNTRYEAVCTMLVNTADCLEANFKDDQQMCGFAVDLWMMSVQYYADHIYIYDEWQRNINLVDNSIGSKIRKYKPSYTFPAPNTDGFPDFVIMQINKKYSRYSRSNSSGSLSSPSDSSSSSGILLKFGLFLVIFMVVLFICLVKYA